MNDTPSQGDLQGQDQPEPGEVKDSSLAFKRWLRSAMDRRELRPKEIYLELRIDASTWSRYESLQHEHTLPASLLPDLLALLDAQATTDLIFLLKRGRR